MSNLILPRFSDKGNMIMAQRHGFSFPNAAKRIVSDPLTGCLPEHGLTDVGRDQVRIAVLQMLHLLGPTRTVIVHSPFSRTEDSALVASAIIHPRERYAESGLRERYFGVRNGGDSGLYEDVWALDALDPGHTMDGVESAEAVRTRMLQLLISLHERYEGTVILLQGHGDPLQIAETAFRDMPVSEHRTGVAHWRNGEIRILSGLQNGGKRTPFSVADAPRVATAGDRQ